MAFQRATRGVIYVKMAISGPSGSGKSYTALKIAARLAEHYGGRVACIDTEGGSSALYADGRPFDFDLLTLTRFHPQEYIKAIDEAIAGGYKVVVVDSLTHEWTGTGGILEIVDRASNGNGNKFSAWASATPLHNQFIEKLTKSPIHLIGTMRAKEDVRQEKDANGRIQVVKYGMASIQRDGMDYELSIHGMMDYTHTLTIDKTRCDALTDGMYHKPGDDFTDTVIRWLDSGGTPAPTGEDANGPQRPQEPRQPVAPAAQAQQHTQAAPRPPAAAERVGGATGGSAASQGVSLNQRERLASAQEQANLFAALRQAYAPAPGADAAAVAAARTQAEQRVFELTQRPVTMASLREGGVRITVGEVQRVLQALPLPAPAAATAGATAAGNGRTA